MSETQPHQRELDQVDVIAEALSLVDSNLSSIQHLRSFRGIVAIAALQSLINHFDANEPAVANAIRYGLKSEGYCSRHGVGRCDCDSKLAIEPGLYTISQERTT